MWRGDFVTLWKRMSVFKPLFFCFIFSFTPNIGYFICKSAGFYNIFSAYALLGWVGCELFLKSWGRFTAFCKFQTNLSSPSAQVLNGCSLKLSTITWSVIHWNFFFIFIILAETLKCHYCVWCIILYFIMWDAIYTFRYY